MRSYRVLPVVGLALASVGLLAACGGTDNGSQPASPPTTVPATAPAAAPTATQAARAPLTTHASVPFTRSGPQSAAPDVEPVNCGKVGPEGGAQVDLIADSTEAGVVGCTEAFNVIDEYYRDAPTKAEGTAHHLVVQGWDCLADTGAYGSGSIACDKNGFAFHTEP